jgi:serine/threonine protein kinase
MPPQMLMREKYSNKCDIWSLGIMFYELLTGTPPFIGISIEELKRNLNKAVYDLPTDCIASVEAVEIINGCL